MTLLEKIIDTFDGEIMVDNEWRVNGTNGKHYTVKWDPYHKNYSCQCKGYIYRKRCRHIIFGNRFCSVVRKSSK